MPNEYRTVKEFNSEEYIVKRSRFIGYAKPVTTVEEANAFIAEIKTKHWDATHNVYAYILRDGGVKRYSDDGEPQGTAGVPVLDVLEKENLVDVCVVVTRYFGGILLGTGGLVKAYQDSVKTCLESLNTTNMVLMDCYEIVIDHSMVTLVQRLIKSLNIQILNQEYTDKVKYTLDVPLDSAEQLKAQVTQLSSGRAEIKKLS